MNRFRADLALLLVAFIWGSAYVVQRVAAQYFNAFTFNGLRFLLGGLILLPFSKLNPLRRYTTNLSFINSNPAVAPPAIKVDRKSFLYILLAGVVLFSASGLQQVGLQSTTAGNAGFINTLYVVFVPILLLILYKEKTHWLSWAVAGVAIIGSLLLSTGGMLALAKGDALELACSLFFAYHVIVVGRAMRHMDVLTFSAGQYLIAGILHMIVSVVLSMPVEGLMGGWWTIVYIGVLSTAVGYTLQSLAQKYAPPTDATILLSMEAVFAAIIGYLTMNEIMKPIQLVGSGLILIAVMVTQFKSSLGINITSYGNTRM